MPSRRAISLLDIAPPLLTRFLCAPVAFGAARLTHNYFRYFKRRASPPHHETGARLRFLLGVCCDQAAVDLRAGHSSYLTGVARWHSIRKRNAMAHAEDSVTIDRPAETVFDFLLDGMNNPKWRAGVLDIEHIAGTPEGIGARFKQGLKGPGGRRIDGDYQITACE